MAEINEIAYRQTDRLALRANDTVSSSELTKARCADGLGTYVSLFFSSDLIDISTAKTMCRSCDVKESCLQRAIECEEPWGVWGGEIIIDGKIVSEIPKPGRPPKNPPQQQVA